MRKYLSSIIISFSSCFSLLVIAQETRVSDADLIPIPGKWQGDQLCSTLGRDNQMPVNKVTMTVRQNELLNEYSVTGRSNSKFVKADPDAGLTSETPDFIRGLLSSKVLTADGKRQLERLASVLADNSGEVTTYTFLPSDNVVSGKMLCHADEKWCHFEATLRVKFGQNSFEVKGGDMLKVYGDRMVITGYAYDEFSCRPDTCVVVCEANLIKSN